MAVSVKIGDRAFDVAVPYKLRQLEAAAPFIDDLNASARDAADDAGQSMAAMAKLFRAMLGAVLPGIQKVDPAVTLDALVDEFEPSQWIELRAAFDSIFKASGLGEGEAKAAVEVDPAAA